MALSGTLRHREGLEKDTGIGLSCGSLVFSESGETRLNSNKEAET